MGLDAVADFHAALPVLNGQQQQNARVALVLASDAPARGEVDGKILDGLTLQGLDGHHGQLRARLVVEFRGKRFELLSCRYAKHARVIVHVAGGLPLRCLGQRGGCANGCEGGQEHAGKCPHSGLRRFWRAREVSVTGKHLVL